MTHPPRDSSFEQDVTASDALRARQAGELDEYIVREKVDRARFNSMFTPNYQSEAAYTESTRALRQAFADNGSAR